MSDIIQLVILTLLSFFGGCSPKSVSGEGGVCRKGRIYFSDTLGISKPCKTSDHGLPSWWHMCPIVVSQSPSSSTSKFKWGSDSRLIKICGTCAGIWSARQAGWNEHRRWSDTCPSILKLIVWQFLRKTERKSPLLITSMLSKPSYCVTWTEDNISMPYHKIYHLKTKYSYL